MPPNLGPGMFFGNLSISQVQTKRLPVAFLPYSAIALTRSVRRVHPKKGQLVRLKSIEERCTNAHTSIEAPKTTQKEWFGN